MAACFLWQECWEVKLSPPCFFCYLLCHPAPCLSIFCRLSLCRGWRRCASSWQSRRGEMIEGCCRFKAYAFWSRWDEETVPPLCKIAPCLGLRLNSISLNSHSAATMLPPPLSCSVLSVSFGRRVVERRVVSQDLQLWLASVSADRDGGSAILKLAHLPSHDSFELRGIR